MSFGCSRHPIVFLFGGFGGIFAARQRPLLQNAAVLREDLWPQLRPCQNVLQKQGQGWDESDPGGSSDQNQPKQKFGRKISQPMVSARKI